MVLQGKNKSENMDGTSTEADDALTQKVTGKRKRAKSTKFDANFILSSVPG